MSVVVKHLRITRAQLNARASAGTIQAGQVYLISDEKRLAVGLTTTTYETFVKETDAIIPFVIDGGGVAITTGAKPAIEIPFPCTILGWTITGDQSGSIVIDLKKATYANFPTTTSITASAKPTVSSAQKATSSTLTGWTTAVAAGDLLQPTVDSVTSFQTVTLNLRVRKT